MRQNLAPVTDEIVGSIETARSADDPFLHLIFERFFPDSIYQRMLDSMPNSKDCRPMHGRSRELREDGKSTRVKLDLLPEYIRRLPKAKREVWDMVGQALRSPAVRSAFVRRLASEMERRFGPDYVRTGLYSIPILTRDIPGYRIIPHTDTHWKAITVQLYLARDDAHAGIGTVFHRMSPEGTLERATQMRFVRNGAATPLRLVAGAGIQPIRSVRRLRPATVFCIPISSILGRCA